MKKQFIVLITLLALNLTVSAQKEYRLAKSSGQLNLNINGAVIEGYDGKEIIFSTQKTEDEKVDERAKGLLAISGAGYTDNTGLGISVVENGQEINVNTVNKNRKGNGILSIKVPKNIKISFNNNSNTYYDNVVLKDLNSEIEISTTYNDIKLENNTGPMNVKTMYGSVDAIFKDNIKGPVSIISVYKHVDVALPTNIKANIELATSSGNLYAAKEFNIVVNKKDTSKPKQENISLTGTINGGNVVAQSGKEEGRGVVTTVSSGNGIYFSSGFKQGENIKGTINGGGVDLIFKSNYKNVYLRQK
jgi:hypothetical protein